MPVKNDSLVSKFRPRHVFRAVFRVLILVLVGAGIVSARKSILASATASPRYGLNSRPQAKACLQMPNHAEGPLPRLLSQTGVFSNTDRLLPDPALIPYDLNVSFWSDGAGKLRWITVPDGRRIKFSPTGEWSFPDGTVFVKHFELPTDETRPNVRRRLETRLLVRDSTGGVYGVTYKWRADNHDADLLDTNLTEAILIKTATGVRTQLWYYPSRSDCLVCHTANAGGVLGVKTRQLNRDFKFPSGVIDNELRTWNHVGLFDPELDEARLPGLASLAQADDATRNLEDRARSYLDANCAQCHRPQGTVAGFDARYDTPLAKQNLIEGPVLINEGIDGARLIAPNDIWRSILFMRINTLEALKMPPLAHNELDQRSVTLLKQWIGSLPGPPVLAPPTISPRGGNYQKSIEVTLSSEPVANIHYTLDGTVPTTSDPLYHGPIRLNGPTIVRAKSFKAGFTRSITAQEVFVVGD